MHNNNNLIHYKIFQPFKNLTAFTTTKQTFQSHNPRFTGNTDLVYRSNRFQLAELLNLSAEQLVFPRQTHTNCVEAVFNIPDTEIKDTDALITNRPGICICVQTADCVPILIFDRQQNVISVVHAGWRGTVTKIVEKTVQKMKFEFNTNPINIIAAIGPSIGPNIYEVGNEVVDAVRERFTHTENLLIKNGSGKFHFNLWEANKQLLLENNVHAENIEILGDCSFELADKYYSARREGFETGRMVSGIYLRN